MVGSAELSIPEKSPTMSRVGAALLMVMVALIVFERLHTFDEPLDRDIAGYAVIAHEMLAGRQLYSDLWERKPPLLYASFAVAERLTQYGPGEIFLLNVVCAVGTLGAIYVAGGIFGAVLWTILCGDMWVLGNQPNAEAFVNLFLACGFAVLTRSSGRLRPMRAVAIGALFAGATLYKHHAIVIVAAVLAVKAFSGRRERSRSIEVVIAFSVILGAWLLVGGYFAAVGRFGPMYSALFSQNIAYSGSLTANLLHSVLAKNLFPPAMRWTVVPLVLIAGWMVAGSSAARTDAWLLCGTYLLSAWIVIALPGYFWPHYYQLLMPPFCIAGGWAAAGLMRSRSWMPGVIRLALVGGVIAFAACWEASSYRLSPQQWAREKEATDDLPAQQAMAIELNRKLPAGAHFWELGEDNILYFASGRKPPSGLLYMEPLANGPERDLYAKRLLNDLMGSGPELIVVDQRWAGALPSDSGIQDWMAREYVPYRGDLNRFTFRILIRRGYHLPGEASMKPEP